MNLLLLYISFQERELMNLIKSDDQSVVHIPNDILHFKFDLLNLKRNPQLSLFEIISKLFLVKRNKKINVLCVMVVYHQQNSKDNFVSPFKTEVYCYSKWKIVIFN